MSVQDGAPGENNLELVLEALEGWGEALSRVDAGGVLRAADGCDCGPGGGTPAGVTPPPDPDDAKQSRLLKAPSGPDFGGPELSCVETPSAVV